MINVQVRDLGGQSWVEHWEKEKLAYLILMSDLREPKFERALATDWVPSGRNLYSWDKAELSKEEADRIARPWPKSFPRPFNPDDCDSVQFVFSFRGELTGVGFHPSDNPSLYRRIVRLSADRLQYIEFNYAQVRHIFEVPIDNAVAKELTGDASSDRFIKRLSVKLWQALHSGQPEGNITLLCRHPGFEPPFSYWVEL